MKTTNYFILLCLQTLKIINMDNKEKVLETIKKGGKPLKGGEIAEASGIDKKEVDKAIKSLITEGKIVSPQRCYYSLK